MNQPRSGPKILVVDDKPQNLYALEKLLAKLEVEVIQATSGFAALSLTLEHDFCLAIVDVQMPEMDGYELVELLRGNPSTASLPVIFVSAIFSDEYHHRKGYDTGAVDFLSKPFVPEILLSKAGVFLDLYHQRIKLEKLVNQLNAKNEALENEIKQRQQAETALQKANSDKDKLFAIISHDLRGPFQPLLGNAQLIMNQMERFTQTDIQAMANDIYRSARAILNLLDNLLTWSRLQQERMEYIPEPIELRSLADSTVNLLKEVARGKKIRLDHTIEAGLFVQADNYMVDTIIRNLTSNALKFTPIGGQVTLSAHRNGLSSGKGEPGWVEVRVTDTGIGMRQEDIDKLFKIDVHHTTLGTSQETGTGLGLILCQEMVLKNGGQIWVESEENQGTTVTFTLPATDYPHPENGQNGWNPLKSSLLASTETNVI
jgi:signal transduction histidine kinase